MRKDQTSRDRDCGAGSAIRTNARGNKTRQSNSPFNATRVGNSRGLASSVMSTTSPRRGGPFNFVTWSLLRLGGVLLCSVGIAQASTVATPTFSPAAGTYTSIQTVTISDSTSGATIYYTTNGSTPTTSSTHYTSPITVSSSETVKAIGTKSGYTQSAVGSAAYTINLTVATPTFSPTAGTYTTVQTVTISDTTSGSTLYYTTNGSTPTPSSTQYTSPITVSSSETVKAIGTESGYTESAVGSAAYTINLTVATPTFSPVAGTYTTAQTVTISDTTSGSAIYYTTNGSTPTTSSTPYTSPITVSSTETVKAIATASGYAESAVGSAAYTINLTTATPGFSPGAGSYSSPQTVTISDSTPGATIYYTTNGTNPTTSSPVYSSPVGVNTTETLEAIATASGYAQSAVGSATYTLAAPTPIISPGTGTYAYGYGGYSANPTISDSNPSATIYYTNTNGTTGTTPTTSSSVYSGPLGVVENQVVEAMAVVPGYANSAIATATYTVPVPPPSISLSPGTYVGSQTVTISDVISSRSTIYYTTNGTTPTTSSTKYTSAITVSSSENLQAIATYTGFATSAVSAAAYAIDSTVPVPTISPAAGSYPGPQIVTVGESALNATVHYTITAGTTGTAPTTSSPVYTGAITIAATETVEAMAAVSGYASSAAVSATYTLPSQASSTTSIAVTSGGNPVTSVTSGSVVTLTATVLSGGTSITNGTVDFCDATATYCTGIHLLGTAQLTSAGTAKISLTPGGGSHSYKATFVGTSAFASSSSSTASLGVTGIPTSTSIAASGTPPLYTLTGTVTGSGIDITAPTGTVSFLDTNNGNATVGSATLASAGTALSFANSTILSTPGVAGAYPYYPGLIAVADFNGDGKPDLAILDNQSLLIELGNGNGSFTAAPDSPINLNCGASSIVSGDVNGDGIPDLALSCGGSITILLGNGNGSFTQAAGSPFSLPASNPVSVAVGDFNRDGKLDLAVATSVCCSTNDLIIMLGNGNGTFTEANGSPLTVGHSPNYVAVGDFNGDGKPDLAVSDSSDSTLTIFLGNGDGTFTAATGSPISASSDPIDIAVGDFNGDGKSDLAVALNGGNSVMVLLSNGNGTFTQASGSPYGVIYEPTAVAVGEFNGNGIQDLAVASASQNQVVILSGTGTGTFGGYTTVSTGNQPESISVADFNGDGTLDMAVANYQDQTVAVWLTDLITTATATANNVAVVGSGTHNIDANYGGDTNYGSSTSSTTPLTTVVDDVTGVSPGSGSAGTAITITGSGFGASQGSSTVTVGGVNAVASSWSNTQVLAQIPNGPGPGPQSVLVNVGGQAGPGGTVTVTPTISTVTPSTGYAGSFVVVSGTNFGSQISGSSSVTFNGTPVQSSNWTPSAVGVMLPAGVTTGPVVVTGCNPSASWCGSTNSLTFTVPTGPTILGLSPVAGPIGSTITVSGQNFGTSGTVTFNGVTATPTTWGIDTIVTPVPAGATTGPVVVTTEGTASAGYTFTVNGGVTGISPVQGSAGTGVTITGTGFGSSQGTGTVMFNGVSATVSSWSNTSIIAIAPTGAVTGSVAVQVNGLTNLGPVFTFLPAISSLSPSTSPIGTSITISGASFGANQDLSAVYFGQIVGVPTQWSPSTIVVPVPPDTVSAPVTVVVGSETSNGVEFTVGATSSGGSITGTITQSSGGSAISGATVTVLSGNAPVATSTTNGSGNYSVSNLSAGSYNVEVSAFGFGAASQSSVSVTAGQASTVNLSLAGQPVITYSYDALGRLVGVASPSQGAAAYSYDPVGNILSISVVGTNQVSVLSFAPTTGPVGTVVTISGSAFSAAPSQDTVTIGGAAATVMSATTTQLVVTVPPGAVTGTISVTSPSGTASSSTVFTVGSPAGAPSISSFTPAMASAGAAVTVAGSAFDVLANDQLGFNGTLAYLTSATPTNIVATLPAAAQSGPISITTPSGSASSSANFYVIPSGYTSGQVDFIGSITVGGSPYTGTLVNSGDIGMVVFSATTGEPLSLSISGSTVSDANVSIIGPNGSTIESEAIGTGETLLDGVTAPLSGAYTVLVQSAVGTGNLTLTLSQSSSQSNGSESSQSEEINIDTPGQSVTVPFNGTAGQIVSVCLNNSSFTGFITNVGVTVLNPNGSTLFSGSTVGTGSFLIGSANLPTTGTYTIVLTSLNGNTGSATVLISLFQNQTISVTPVAGGTASTAVAINVPGQQALLTFSGTAGQMASFVLNDSTFTGGSSNVGVSILNPNGSTLISGTTAYQGNFIFGPVSLPTTGTYTVVISPGINSGSTNVLVSLFSNQTGTITSGTPDNVTITIPGQEAVLSFSGTSGQSASVQINNSTFTGGAYNVGVSILNPNGSTLYSSTTMYQGNFSFGPVTLPTTGTYTIVIAPGINSGNASITLTLQ